MKIRLFSNYDSSIHLTHRFNRNYKITDDKLTFVVDDDYDVALILNKTSWYEPIKEGVKVITVIQEPSWSPCHQGNTFLQNSDYLLIHHADEFRKKHHKLGGEIVEGASYMWFHDDLDKMYFLSDVEIKKKKKISMIVSGINLPIGNYQKRIGLLQSVLDSDLDIDIYGKGLNINDTRFKGELEYKMSGLAKYEYSIAIENSNEFNYVTEKFIDPLLNLTMPIYAGAPNIADIYSPLAFKSLNLDSTTIIDDIKVMIQETPNIEILRLNRNTYFDNYNLYTKLKEILL